MKLTVKCDRCGKEGTADEVSTYAYGERDLCDSCSRIEHLADLKQQYASKMEWLETTHLKELRELEKQIAELEATPTETNSPPAPPALTAAECRPD